MVAEEEVPPKTLLQQLREMTVVVADTGDPGYRKRKPQNATTQKTEDAIDFIYAVIKE